MFTDDSFREILAHFRLFYALVEFNIHANPWSRKRRPEAICKFLQQAPVLTRGYP
jgi:hypothetical protein